MLTREDGRGTVTLDVLGATVRVVGPSPMVGRVAAQWARCRTSRPADRTVELLTWVDADEREYTLASGLNLLGIQLTAGSRVNLHAAGLSDDRGRVVALAAASGTGKTTAARVLGRTLGYVTDECVSVAPDSLDVRPYAKPLSLLPPTGTAVAAAGHKRQVGPDELGLRRAPGRLRLGAVVLLDRVPRTDAPTAPALGPVPLLDALEELVPQTSSAALWPDPLRTLAELLVRTGGARRLTYDEVGGAADLVRQCLDGHHARHLAFEHVPGRATGESLECPGVGRVVVGGHHDAVAVGDDVLVMVGAALVRATGLAAGLWLRLGAGQTADLTRVPAAALRESIAQLEHAGLLTRDRG
ncbi:hypothetical protein ACJ5H2_20430 [Nocardioides sp. R1-1]|uniref:hypothetical protein n=1 Tax=Nocardioides sp. R1-1 TaxID=3383502 RepID=UPI0038D093E1